MLEGLGNGTSHFTTVKTPRSHSHMESILQERPPKESNNDPVDCRYWTRDHTEQWSLTEGKQTWCILIGPAHCLERAAQRGGPQIQPSIFPKLKKCCWAFGESKAARIHRTEFCGGESCTERRLWNQQGAPLESLSTDQCMSVRKLHKADEKQKQN